MDIGSAHSLQSFQSVSILVFSHNTFIVQLKQIHLQVNQSAILSAEFAWIKVSDRSLSRLVFFVYCGASFARLKVEGRATDRKGNETIEKTNCGKTTEEKAMHEWKTRLTRKLTGKKSNERIEKYNSQGIEREEQYHNRKQDCLETQREGGATQEWKGRVPE